MQQALGANRWNIVRKVLLESIILSLAGAALGIVVAIIGIQLVDLLRVEALPLGEQVAFDWRTGIVSIVLAIALCVLLTLPVIWLHRGCNIGAQLQSEGRSGTSSRRVQHLRHSLIVAQIAFAFVLLCGAGLLSVSLRRALENSPGFEIEKTPNCRNRYPVQELPAYSRAGRHRKSNTGPTPRSSRNDVCGGL